MSMTYLELVLVFSPSFIPTTPLQAFSKILGSPTLSFPPLLPDQTSDPRMIQEGSFQRELNVLVPFLVTKKIGGPLGPLHSYFFPKVTGLEFWDSHLICHSRKTLITMFSETTYSTTVPVRGAASYKLWAIFKYSNSYWEVYRHLIFWFLGREKLMGVMWEDLSTEEFVMGEDNLNEGGAGFSSII